MSETGQTALGLEDSFFSNNTNGPHHARHIDSVIVRVARLAVVYPSSRVVFMASLNPLYRIPKDLNRSIVQTTSKVVTTEKRRSTRQALDGKGAGGGNQAA